MDFLSALLFVLVLFVAPLAMLWVGVAIYAAIRRSSEPFEWLSAWYDRQHWL
jgi:hypothetical protein